MDEIIAKTKQEIEKILQNEEEHQDKKIDFILINPNTNETLTIASNGYDSMIYFAPYTIDEKNKYVSVADWDFSFDQYFFQGLQNGYQIGYITDETHYNLWNALQEYYPEDIEYKDGVQWYLQYCADNGITKEYLDKKTNLDTPNIIDFFKGLALHETMTYKGYVIEADDTNYDNPKENIVNIYKSQEDFNENKINESVSLNTINLKQNIKEYIDDVYIDKTDFESEKSYITFVLGYDLLNDMIKRYDILECDTNYEFCNNLAEQFLNSKEYSNFSHSSYEMLEQYINNNKMSILKDYENFIEQEGISFDDNKTLLIKGNRGDQPVALIKWAEEYVIAIDYTIDESRIYWSRGYYYDDIKDAKEDFNRVIKGEYLFDNHNEQEQTLNIKFIGIDNWDRPVYKDKDGIIYKDINLGNGVLALTTSVNNDFYGEPDCSIDNNVKINIVQKLENEQQMSSHEQDR